MLDINDWLKKRTFNEKLDPRLLQDFQSKHNLEKFADISTNKLVEFGTDNGLELYDLLTTLGLYGVNFSENLVSYSPKLFDSPVLVSSTNVPEKDIRDVKELNRDLINFFGQLKINNTSHLHGIRLDTLSQQAKLDYQKLANIIQASGFSLIENDSDIFNFYSKKEADPLDELIENTDLSRRAKNVAKNMRIEVLRDLLLCSTEKLLQQRNCGSKTVHEIEDLAKIMGFKGLPIETEKKSIILQPKDFSPIIYDGEFQLENFKFSTRANHILRSMNVNSYADLFSLNPTKLMQQRHCGQVTTREIMKVVKRQSKKKESFYFSSPPVKASLPDPLPKEVRYPIKNLNLSTRAQNILKKKNIMYLWQLSQVSKSELLNVKSCGQITINELSALLRKFGLPQFSANLTEKQIAELTKETTDISLKTAIDQLLQLPEIVKDVVCGKYEILTRREQEIASKRGFFDNINRTLESVATSMDISQERVRQIQKKYEEKIERFVLPLIKESTQKIICSDKDNQGIIFYEDVSINNQRIINCLLGRHDFGIVFSWEESLIKKGDAPKLNQNKKTGKHNVFSSLKHSLFGKPKSLVVDYNEIEKEVESYILTYSGGISKSEVEDYFCTKNKWTSSKLNNALRTVVEIIPIEKKLFHVTHQNINTEKLIRLINEITDDIGNKSQKLNLRVFQKEKKVLWVGILGTEVDVRTMVAILHWYDKRKDSLSFNLEYPYAIPKNNKTSVAQDLEKWAFDQQDIIHIDQIQQEFANKLGIARSTLINLIDETLIRYDRDEFVHPKFLGYQDKWLEEIEDFIIAQSEERGARGFFHLPIPPLLSKYEDELPQTKDVDWTVDLLITMIKKAGIAYVFYEACVLVDNIFEIDSLDKLVSVIVHEDFNGRVSTKQLTKKLRSDKIIGPTSSIPKKVYASGLLKLVDEKSYVQLTKEGKDYCDR